MLCKQPLALLSGRFGGRIFSAMTSSSSSTKAPSVETRPHTDPEKAWKEREKLAVGAIQRYEKPTPKTYYAPEWQIDFSEEKGSEYSPLKWYGMTPEKWEYYNKVPLASALPVVAQHSRAKTHLSGRMATELRRPRDRTAEAAGGIPLPRVDALQPQADVDRLPVRSAPEGEGCAIAARV